MTDTIPATKYLRLHQIIGRKEVTPEMAAANKKMAAAIRSKFPVDSEDATSRKQQQTALNKALSKIGPRSAKPATTPIIPLSRTSWLKGVKNGTFPKPTKLGRCAVWESEGIYALVQKPVTKDGKEG